MSKKTNLPNETVCDIYYNDWEGSGISYIDGKKIRVVGTIRNEKVKAIRFYKNYYIVDKILVESEKRSKKICPHFPICGGCSILHINYKDQLEFKQTLLEALFKNYNIDKIKPSPLIYNYRNKMEFTFGEKNGRVIIGLIKRFTYHEVVDIEECLIGPKEANEILEIVREFFSRKEIKPYNKITKEGVLRFLIVRKSFTKNELMLNVVASRNLKENFKELKEQFEGKFKIRSLIHAVNEKPVDTARGEIVAVFGKNYIEEEILQKKYRIYPYSFFQVNTLQAKEMLEFVRKNIKNGGKKALDLYSGVGFFSIGIADLVEEVLGVEIDPEAVRSAYENSKLNNVENVKFENMPAENIGVKISESNVDYLILDPPRAGLQRKVIRWIARSRPENIIYISCNPYTLIRDLKYITKAGYTVEKLQPFDQFPHTPHIETIAIISRKKF